MLNENLGFEGSCDVTFDLGTNCKISRIFEKKRDAMYRLVYTCAHACTWRQNPLTTNRPGSILLLVRRFITQMKNAGDMGIF